MFFDEEKLQARVADLPLWGAIAFGACCTERLMPSLIWYATSATSFEKECFLQGLELMWRAAAGEELDRRKVELVEKQCVSSLPNEDQAWNIGEPYAEDAAAAVVYVLRVWLTNQRDSAVFAARRAYEAMDHMVTSEMESFPNSQLEERDVINHPVIKQELERQQTDLKMIEESRSCTVADLVHSLREKAKTDSRTLLL